MMSRQRAPTSIASSPRIRSYDFHRAIGLLAHAESRGGDPIRAEALFKSATDISTLSETYYNYASFLAAQQRTAEAREWAQKILAKKPTMPRYLQRRERPWFPQSQGADQESLKSRSLKSEHV